VSWLTEDWRLKLLALGLAILMLGAVAFAQNPPTTKTLKRQISYKPSATLVAINPPPSVSVTVTGLSDAIENVTADNLFATVDLSHASAGQAVKLNVTVTTTANVTIQPPPPIVVHMDTIQEKDLPVQVVAHPAPGWVVTKTSSIPDTVHFTGPASWAQNLVAFVNYASPVQSTTNTQLNQLIQLQNNNGALNLEPCTTVPCANLDVQTATITIEAQTGSSSSTVPLVAAAPSRPPPADYEVTGVTISPLTVIITGDPTTLGKIQRIILPAVDLSSYTSTAQFRVNIPFPDGVNPVGSVTTATITYTIQRNPTVSSSPSP
jgi:YbbR domain-containing protein